jgi:thiol-disulfide isomerase/thioredoxin
MPLASSIPAQSKVNFCEPAGAIKEELRKLPKYNVAEASYSEYQKRRRVALEALAGKYPADVFVQRSWADLRRNDQATDREALIGEYRARVEKSAENTVPIYLYARLLVGTATKEATERLTQLASRSPEFPLTHQELAQIYNYPAFRDQAKSREHLLLWIAKCPTSLEGVSQLSRSGDPELMRNAEQRLRARLKSSTDPEDYKYYDDLWSIEFKLKPVTEHPQVREQIAKELQQLREKNPGGKEWLLALQSGYKMTNDKEGRQWVESEIERLYPNSSENRRLARQRWEENHPRPNPDEPENLAAYNRALTNATNQWLKRWPGDLDFIASRFYAYLSYDDAADAEVEEAGEAYLNALAADQGYMFSIPPAQTQVASMYAKRKIATDRLPSMLLNGLEEIEARSKRDGVNDLFPAAPGVSEDGNLKYVRWMSWPLLAEAYAKLKQPEKARESLARMTAALNKEKPEAAAKAPEKNAYLNHQARYWQTVAIVAEAESRKLDALTAYQTALSFRPKSFKPRKGKKDELTDDAERLWKDLGGTREGWEAYLARNEASKGALEVAEVAAWDQKNQPLPEFTLSDLQGKAWTPADLKGKVAFINFWATWCSPCLMELPYVQKLHEQLKDNKDVMVLTFNIDDELGLVEPFVKDKKYTFPVLPAQTFAQNQDVYSIPRNWIVNAEGRLQFEGIGFGADGEEWMKKAIDMIQKAKASKEAGGKSR